MPVINTALCSFGMSGWVFHAPFITAHPGFNLYAVVERSKNLAAEKYPAVKTFRSVDEMLQDANIDLVVVNTPSVTHFDLASKALLAGKHVIVEKPFTATVAEAAQLIELAAQQQRMLSVYQNRRWDSDFTTVKNMIASGALGTIKEAEIHYDRFTPTLSPKMHKEAPTPAVGILYDLGSHLIDQALQLFGWPQAVFADIAIYRSNSKVDDYFEILLYYATMRVRLKATFFAREPQGYIIHGTKGSFIKSRADVQEAALQAHIVPNSKGWGIEPVTETGWAHYEKEGAFVKEQITTATGNYMKYYDGIYEALVNKTTAPVTATDAKKVISIIEAAYKSNAAKKVITV